MIGKWRRTLKETIVQHPLMSIAVVSLLLLLPQLVSGNMIIGNDSIFHFNRFYDTAMQIKEGNFQYFVTMYGFQQSGRIVNALYSPYFAYLQGGLLLIAKTWFNFQLLSNFLLYVGSGFSMYFFLKKLKVKTKIRLTIAVIYLSTFAVQYWITRQGFSSWGAALLPICLTPIIDMEDKNEVKLSLGFYTALMMQTHLLTTLFLVMIYLPFYLRAFVKSSLKIRFIAKTLLSIGFFFLLTLNLWISMFQVYSGNEILAPFINHSMAESTITYSSFYCLLTPFFLIFIILAVVITACKAQKLTGFLKTMIWTGVFFLILGSNLVPWTFLLEHNVKIAELIQFPFRFIIPATVLILSAFALLLNDYTFERLNRFKLQRMVILAILQTLILQIVLLTTWSKPEDYIFAKINVYTADIPTEQVKAAFYSEDLGLALQYIQKSTPDYLPVYSEHEGSRYKLYKAQIIDKESQFQRRVVGDKLVVNWKGNEEATVQVPVFGYKNTKLRLNGKKLTETDNYSQIGAISVHQQLGENRLEVSYQRSKFLYLAIFLSIANFVGYLAVVAVGRIRKILFKPALDLKRLPTH